MRGRGQSGGRRGLEFGAAFGEAGDDDSLANLRTTFRRKAFQGRQEALLRTLLAQGLGKAALVAMTVEALESTAVAEPRAPTCCAATWR